MSSPLVSILTPSFNQARWLPDNLASVASQTYSRIEHIVMDGGSTDDSIDILKHFPSRGLYWQSEPDRGQSEALNKAFAKSCGTIIGWINSDDAYIDRRSVASVVATFERHPEVDVVYGHSLLVNGFNQVLQFLWAPPFFLPLTKVVTPFYQPAVFFRRAILGDKMVDESLQYVMDFDLWARLWGVAMFKRVNRVIGLERHQPHRKIMSEAYVAERKLYDMKHGMNRTSRTTVLAQRSYASFCRSRSAASVILAERPIDEAVALIWPPLPSRLKLQLLTRRSSMDTGI